MNICFIAPANNYHTRKWADWFAKKHEVHVVSFVDGIIQGATVHYINTNVDVEGSDGSKIKYLFYSKRVKKIVEEIKPDIVNVHYATSYGTVTALSGLKTYVLSVWGSDIYDFPRKSFFHKSLLKYSLWRASFLFSTSNAMAEEGRNYTKKKYYITPFGVDMGLFNPDKRNRNYNDGKYVIGTVKGLSDKYGIADILRATAIIRKKISIPIELRIAGKGPKENEYKELSKKMMIDDVTVWLGFITQEQAATEWANMDVAIIPSTLESESFGVSAVEAQACGTPVVISDIPGLMEATQVNKTSIVVKRNDYNDLAEKIVYLYENKKEAKRMGDLGREFVVSRYELNDCFAKIENLFNSIKK